MMERPVLPPATKPDMRPRRHGRGGNFIGINPSRHGLALSRRCFLLRKPLERGLYGVARRHCGARQAWKTDPDALRDRCGPGPVLREFRRLAGRIIEGDGERGHMPDCTFGPDGGMVPARPEKEAPQSAPPLASLRPMPDTRDDARRPAPGWDMRVPERDWRSRVIGKGIAVRNPDRRFPAFCGKRGP